MNSPGSNQAGPPRLTPIPPHLKGDRESIEHRRNLVRDMMLRGMSLVSIAKVLGVHRNTILNDAKEIRRQMRQSIKELDPIQEVANDVEHYQMIAQEAIVQYYNAEKHSAKKGWMEVSIRAMDSKVKLLALTGLIPTQGLSGVVDAEVAAERSRQVETKFGKTGVKAVLQNPESRRKLISAMSLLIQTGKKELLAMTKEDQHGQGAGGATGGEGGAEKSPGGTPGGIKDAG